MINVEEFKTWCKAHEADALTVCAAQAFAACEKERVAAYVLPIFKKYAFRYAERWNKGEALIEKPEDLYLCDDEPQVAKFYNECDAAHRAHGFDGPEGHCPALTADWNMIQVENAFLKEAAPLFDLDGPPVKTEHRKKMLDLLLGACLTKQK